MPVPPPSGPAPHRRFLADEAYTTLVAAIQDGTLRPGERLHDAELSAWLGVSRSPLRVAIERLVDQGLVQMEANRFTRVAPADPATFVSTAQVVAALHRRSIARLLPTASAQTLQEFALAVAEARRLLDAEPAGAAASVHLIRAVQAVTAFFTARSDNLPLRRRASALSTRLTFLAHAMDRPADRTSVQRFLAAVEVAVRGRDVIAATDALRRLAFEDAARFVAGDTDT